MYLGGMRAATGHINMEYGVQNEKRTSNRPNKIYAVTTALAATVALLQTISCNIFNVNEA